jgi:hypothetical protein
VHDRLRICIFQINSTNIELRSQEKRGLLWLLDEESVFPGATDESFLERVFVHYTDRSQCSLSLSDRQSLFADDGLIRRSRHYNHIVLRHCLGTNPVTYNVSGWLRQAQENPVTRGVLSLLQDSQKYARPSLRIHAAVGCRQRCFSGVRVLTSPKAEKYYDIFARKFKFSTEMLTPLSFSILDINLSNFLT